MATQVLLESRDQQASLENLESQDPRELRDLRETLASLDTLESRDCLAPLDQLVIGAQEQDQEDLAQLDPRDSRDQREHLANQEPLDQLDLTDNRDGVVLLVLVVTLALKEFPERLVLVGRLVLLVQLDQGVNKDPEARRVPVDRKARREWMVIREILEQMELQAEGEKEVQLVLLESLGNLE